MSRSRFWPIACVASACLPAEALGNMASSDCEESIAAPCEVRRRTRGKTAPSEASSRNRGRSMVPDDLQGGRCDTAMCHLCERAIDDNGGREESSSSANASLKKKRFHNVCWNAVRAHRRLHSGPALAALDKNMLDQPLEWRLEVSPWSSRAPASLATPPPAGRPSSAPSSRHTTTRLSTSRTTSS